MELKTLIVVNPNARSGEVGRLWPQLEREVIGALAASSAGEHSVSVVQTGAEDKGIPQVRAALKEGVKRVVVVGGDGTLSDVVQGFFENGKVLAPDASVAVVPCGRGSDFFKSIQKRKGSGFAQSLGAAAWKQALELLRQGSPHPLDVARVDWLSEPGEEDSKLEPRYWVNVLSFGFPGLVVEKVHEEARFFGLPIENSFLSTTGVSYVAQSLAAFLEYRALRMSVKVDGVQLYEGPAFGAFVLNGAYNSGGVCWSNLARFDDGFLDVMVLGPRGIVRMASTLPQMATGQWGGTAGVEIARGKVVELSLEPRERKRHHLFEVDGDLPEGEATRGARISILSGAIQIWR